MVGLTSTTTDSAAPQRRPSLSETWDVIVVGGGPGGVSAAVAAARTGARTLLIEQCGYLGGALTAMGVSPMMTFHAGGTQVVRGIPAEVVERLVARGWSPGHIEDPVGFASSVTPFAPEGLKIVLDEICEESGVAVLFHSTLIDCIADDSLVRAIRVTSKRGPMTLRARVFVDATGDADLAAAAGVPTRQGRDGDGATQPMTMNLKVYGVDSRALDEFQRLHPDQTYQGDGARVARSARSGISGAYRILAEARSRGDLSYEREAVLAFEGAVPGEFTINMSRIAGLDPTDPLERSRAEVIGRRQADETVRFLRAHVPGFEHCRLMGTGPSIGVRESRRIRGMHELTARELVTNTMFDDAVSMGGYPIDLHDPDGRSTTHYVSLREGSWYSIPYRSLVPRELGNLIVAGRCLSATQDALAAVRVTPVVMGFSQASGTAAALAARTDTVTDLRTLDAAALRTRLTADGVFLDAYRERRG